MRPVCIVGSRKSSGARELVAALVALGAKAVRSETSLAGHFNVGWGHSGADLNRRIPRNKLHELQVCEKAGVSIVPFVTDFARTQGERWFGRRLSHTRGLDIFDLRPGTLRREVPARDFWTKVITKRREYRVHVFDGKAVRSGTKMKETGEFTDDQPIWNLDHGFQIRYEHSAPVGAKEVAKAACKALGLDFCAVDVMEGQDGKFYFLEANTKPGLHGNTCQKYAEKIYEKAKEA
jgi:hypothetical protein